MNPVLLRKGGTSVALYGLGNMRDERLNRMWNKKKACGMWNVECGVVWCGWREGWLASSFAFLWGGGATLVTPTHHHKTATTKKKPHTHTLQLNHFLKKVITKSNQNNPPTHPNR